ncbi:MAG: hypothetical protein CL935_00140 [Deltaproteobacteria bacterium]|nr:hypothetical protein [Deltaproteobacteria bacterium]|tara:strand:+ start:1101 stop:1472 length:372 start_codon:yes stop_codon:yes gene_type:complete
MSRCKFYVINTQKSQELVDGLHKITLECENRFDVHGFLWIDKDDEIMQIQILFGEIAIEWRFESGIKYSLTNRATEIPEGIGFHKGVRDLRQAEETDSIESVKEAVLNAEFPSEWSEKIKQKF